MSTNGSEKSPFLLHRIMLALGAVHWCALDACHSDKFGIARWGRDKGTNRYRDNWAWNWSLVASTFQSYGACCWHFIFVKSREVQKCFFFKKKSQVSQKIFFQNPRRDLSIPWFLSPMKTWWLFPQHWRKHVLRFARFCVILLLQFTSRWTLSLQKKADKLQLEVKMIKIYALAASYWFHYLLAMVVRSVWTISILSDSIHTWTVLTLHFCVGLKTCSDSFLISVEMVTSLVLSCDRLTADLLRMLPNNA